MDIRVRNISKAYNGVTVLKELDLTIREGSINCIMGASGSGKTTLANILMGLVKPDKGEVQGLAGEKITAVFQEDRLIEHWDAVKNILLVCGKQVTEAVVRDHLKMVGLDEEQKKPVRSYSGGMRRRVALVRALLADGKVILLDEPFKGLDEALRLKVISYLKEQTHGKTLILITHDKEDARLLGAEIQELTKTD